MNVCLCGNVSVHVCASVRAGVCVRVAVRGSQIGKTTTGRSQDQGCNAFDGFDAFNSFDVQTFSVHCIRRVLRILCATTQKKITDVEKAISDVCDVFGWDQGCGQG